MLSRFRGSARAIDERLVLIEERLDRQADRLATQADRLANQRRQLDRHGERLDNQFERLETQRQRLEVMERHTRVVRGAQAVVENHVSSLETRLDELLADAPPVVADDGEQQEARSLLDEVRREHSLIRVRFGVITGYEERIRRLEEAMQSAARVEQPSSEAESDEES